jgi:hypothetical protein
MIEAALVRLVMVGGDPDQEGVPLSVLMHDPETITVPLGNGSKEAETG